MTEQILKKYPTFKIGDLVTFHFYTDSYAGRLVKVKHNGKEIVFQKDLSKLKSTFKSITINEDFVGYCTNQNEQEYIYTPDLNGTIKVLILRKLFDICCWTEKGRTPSGRNHISHGQKTYHDYNF